MRIGDVLNGYEIVTAPTNAGGGQSQWAFARKNGRDYFVKMFLAPRFPLDDSPGSPAAKARKRDVCLAFERRHLEIAGRLDPTRPGGGNLVIPVDFFRVEATYVKVMEKVDAVTLPPIQALEAHQVSVLLRSLAFSLRMLHEKDIVHGDIKPDNIMVELTEERLYISKLIDFDEAYIVGSPPGADLIVGDPSYYSPELLRYIKRDERLPADALGTASDMFSLGLVLHDLFAGELPGFDRTKVNYAAEAMLGRLSLDVSRAPAVLQPLLHRMLVLVPQNRPTIDEFIQFLNDVDPAAMLPGAVGGAVARPPAPTPAPAPLPAPTPAPARDGWASGEPSATPVLRSTMGRRKAPSP